MSHLIKIHSCLNQILLMTHPHKHSLKTYMAHYLHFPYICIKPTPTTTTISLFSKELRSLPSSLSSIQTEPTLTLSTPSLASFISHPAQTETHPYPSTTLAITKIATTPPSVNLMTTQLKSRIVKSI